MTKRSEVEINIQTRLNKINYLQSMIINRKLDVLHITRSQFDLLTKFMDKPKEIMTITQLVQVMDMKQPGVTKVAGQLITKNFLELVPNNKDKRVKGLRVTKKGITKCNKAKSIIELDLLKLFSGWKVNEIKKFEQYLERFDNDFRKVNSKIIDF